jgi:molybdopterin molybdotransferase
VFRKSQPDGRLHLLRVLVREREGALHASLAGPQGSGILSSMTRSNALALIGEDASAVPQGGPVLLHLTEEAEDH